MITDYNRYMGGVDNFDKLISLYQVHHKGTHTGINYLYTRIIYYLMEIAMVNSYILFRKSMKL